MTTVGQFAYTTLINCTALTALVPATSIFPSRSEEIVKFPSVYFCDEQHDIEYVDNLPQGNFGEIPIDVYVRDDSPDAISQIICSLFRGLYWACTFNKDIPDPETAVRHRHMIFSRPLLAGDI
jgi:hypothetical protein